MTNQLQSPGLARRFILGGNATFTLQLDSGKHFTYRIKSKKIDPNKNWSTSNVDKTLFFVSVLVGPSRESDFQYLGILKLYPVDGEYHFSATTKSKIGSDAESHQAFKKLWHGIEHCAKIPTTAQFYHEGQCCVCGRTLTVPESIERGIGPECASKEGM